MRLIPLLMLAAAVLCAQQAPSGPNVAAQREAMKKLAFMPGKWTGEALVYRGPGEPLKIFQTEEVRYKLNESILLVEGTGRDAAGKVVFEALGTISYDDRAHKYLFRSYNDGRYLDTELSDVSENGWSWGFTAGPAKIRYIMRLNGKDEWTETGEMVLGDNPPRKTFEMKVRRQQ